MTSPFSWRVLDGALVLAEARNIGELSEADRLARLAGAQWVEFDATVEVLDADGALVGHEALALACESRIQGSTTQDAREDWQRAADAHWGLS